MKAYEELPLVGGHKPFSGHLRVMQDDRVAFLDRLAREVPRIARLRTFGVQSVVANHPEVLHEVLVEKARVFEKSQMTRFALYPLAGEGLFTSKGDLWRRQRKLMSPIFHPSQLRSYAADMSACAARGLEDLRDGEVLPLLRETTRITMSIAGKTLFDADTFTEADEIGEALTTALEWSAANAPSTLALAHLFARRAAHRIAERAGDRAPPFLIEAVAKLETPLVTPGAEGRKLRKAIARLDAQVQAMIDARRSAAGAPKDLLARLLEATDDDGARMSDKQVRDEVLTLFVAGHETTATGLAWTVHCLCQNPEIYAAVEREVDALPGDPTFDDLPKLGLTLRVFKEALRLYPPVFMIGRQTDRPESVDGYALARDAVIVVCPYAMHRQPAVWPNPTRFDPDRFVPEAEAARHRLAWMPFSAGPRTCIGNYFAMMEGQIVLAKLLREIHFEPAGEVVPEPHATLRPKDGMPMRITRRR